MKAVDGVSFNVYPGETLGLVGESGCGKSTTGRAILRAVEPTAGEVIFQDQELGEVNLIHLNKQQLKMVRRNIQLIFQDPFASLNPRKTLKQIVGEPFIVNNVMRGAELDKRVAELLEGGSGSRAEFSVALSSCVQWGTTAADRYCTGAGIEPAVYHL